MTKTTKKFNVNRVTVDEVGGDKLNAPAGDKEISLNAKRELFCRFYITDKEFYGNGVESYAEAYGFDLSNPAKYKAAQAGASRLLSNVIVLKRINELMEESVLNDQFVDKQLGFLVTQNADFGAKLGGIREYNKLKMRITEKSIRLNVTVPEPLLGGDARKAMDAYKDSKRTAELVPEAEIVEEVIVRVKK